VQALRLPDGFPRSPLRFQDRPADRRPRTRHRPVAVDEAAPRPVPPIRRHLLEAGTAASPTTRPQQLHVDAYPGHVVQRGQGPRL